MSNNDWLAVAFLFFGIGGGAFLTTFRRGTVRVGGGAIMLIGIVAAALLWSGYLPVADTGVPSAAAPNAGIFAPENKGIITQGQTGGNNTIVQEDNSPERKIRDLFNRIDPNILGSVEEGQPRLAVWMQPFEISDLQALIAKSGTSSPVTITGFGRKDIDSIISNGQLGRGRIAHEKIEVFMLVSSSILARAAQ